MPATAEEKEARTARGMRVGINHQEYHFLCVSNNKVKVAGSNITRPRAQMVKQARHGKKKKDVIGEKFCKEAEQMFGSRGSDFFSRKSTRSRSSSSSSSGTGRKGTSKADGKRKTRFPLPKLHSLSKTRPIARDSASCSGSDREGAEDGSGREGREHSYMHVTPLAARECRQSRDTSTRRSPSKHASDNEASSSPSAQTKSGGVPSKGKNTCRSEPTEKCDPRSGDDAPRPSVTKRRRADNNKKSDKDAACERVSYQRQPQPQPQRHLLKPLPSHPSIKVVVSAPQGPSGRAPYQSQGVEDDADDGDESPPDVESPHQDTEQSSDSGSGHEGPEPPSNDDNDEQGGQQRHPSANKQAHRATDISRGANITDEEERDHARRLDALRRVYYDRHQRPPSHREHSNSKHNHGCGHNHANEPVRVDTDGSKAWCNLPKKSIIPAPRNEIPHADTNCDNEEGGCTQQRHHHHHHHHHHRPQHQQQEGCSRSRSTNSWERDLPEAPQWLVKLAESVKPDSCFGKEAQYRQSFASAISRGVRVTLVASNGVVLWDSVADHTNMEDHGSRLEILRGVQDSLRGIVRFSSTTRKWQFYWSRPVVDQETGRVVHVRFALDWPQGISQK